MLWERALTPALVVRALAGVVYVKCQFRGMARVTWMELTTLVKLHALKKGVMRTSPIW